jgi:HK97 family phage major capsid protein
MKNLDVLQQKKAEIMTKLNQAIKDGDEEAFAQAFTAFTENIQEAVMNEAKGLIQAADNTVLSGRGVRALTSQENQYYQKVIEAMKSSNPKQALTDVDVVLPKTVIDAVFEDLIEDHPLLENIDFVNTSGLIEYLINLGDGINLATWDALCTEIVTEAVSGFHKIDLAHKKLSAFLPVCKAMLDLGPAWLDRYVRTVLAEALNNGLEKGMIDGNGIMEPIGMIRDLNGPIHPVDGYPAKAQIAITDLLPETYGTLVSQLMVGHNGNIRTVSEVVLIVNPIDYVTKVLPATIHKTPNGEYVKDIFPFPTKVIQSARLTQGDAVMGLSKRYFMGIGTSKSGKIEYSDEYRFLEDERIYLVKLYGTGRPKDNGAFLYLDISGLAPAIPNINVANAGDFNFYDARLASLTVGALTLSPEFNKSIFYYTVSTANATNTINAIAMDGEATIAISVNNAAHNNGAAATWVLGANTVEITVTSGTETETYTVIVTKTE